MKEPENKDELIDLIMQLDNPSIAWVMTMGTLKERHPDVDIIALSEEFAMHRMFLDSPKLIDSSCLN